MRKGSFGGWAILAGILAGFAAAPKLALSQSADDGKTLSISGQSGETPILRFKGKSYVEVEALARLTHGTLSFNGNQTILALPGNTANARARTAANAPEFSKEFLKASIEEMAVIREWRIAVTDAVQKGFPVTDDWIAAYRGQAVTNLHLASVAALTDSDRKAYQLLANEFDNMKKLSDRFVAANAARNYTPPDSLSSDALDQKILGCAQSIASMAANGQFLDDGSCH
ncbi:MAG: hypothetical protein WBG02_10650 [Candidatus Acidiferrum sp.]